ncbi:protein kinase [Plantactinospora siamensis]|uniref:non-specific serine/threonine protein kinase n=1 Tax=Plantactinospora siamensis TaxID=555372 RepID=A0ABV6NYS4_9ACTN
MRQVLIGERYRLLRLVGRGGMGRVWLARDEVLHRDVAVKEVVPPEWLSAEERDTVRDRTMREARTTARLSHPNVVRVYDVVLSGDHPWIVMEYVPSRSLQQLITDDGPVPPERAARIGLAVLAALRAAHRAGVLHRDVKPHNVLIADDDRVVLTDFGLAIADGDGRMTRPGMVMGSPQYVSPERAAEGVSTVEADLWSLGATLYAAVEGRSPYARKTSMATLTALATAPPDPARRAGELRPVLDGLLRRNPRHRLDADEVERLLRRVTTEPDARSGTPEAAPGSTTVNGAAGPSVDAAGADPTTPADPTGFRWPGPTDAPETTPRAIRAGRDGGPDGSTDPGRPPDGSGARRRRAWALVLAAGVAVLVVLAAAALLLPRLADRNRGGGPGASPTGPAGNPNPTGPAGSPSASGAARPAAFPCGGAVPAAAAPVTPGPRPTGEPFALTPGWTWYVDAAGYRIATPTGWLHYTDGAVACFREPDGARVLSVDPDTPPTARPDQYFTAQERRLTGAGSVPHYQRVVIQRIDYYAGAEWECRWTNAKGVPVHSYRMLANSGGRAFTIGWLTREFDWPGDQANLLMLRQSFRPPT